MKVLLDENVTRFLKRDLPEHEVWTVRDKRWDGLQNGDLLAAMLADGFDVLVTFDKGIEKQQNFNTYPIPVITIRLLKNSYEYLKPLIPDLKAALKSKLKAGVTIIE